MRSFLGPSGALFYWAPGVRKWGLVSGCEARHCMRARELQTRFEAFAVSSGASRSASRFISKDVEDALYM